jgi:hypothetical protein
MADDLADLNSVMVCRQRARYAEDVARQATSEIQREVLIAVAEVWHAIALQRARARKRHRRNPPKRSIAADSMLRQ